MEKKDYIDSLIRIERVDDNRYRYHLKIRDSQIYKIKDILGFKLERGIFKDRYTLSCIDASGNKSDVVMITRLSELLLKNIIELQLSRKLDNFMEGR